MVIDNKKATNSISQPVEARQSIDVSETQSGLPLKLDNQSINLIKDAWQPKTLLRTYWSVVLASGQGLVIFKDMIENKWYRQGYS